MQKKIKNLMNFHKNNKDRLKIQVKTYKKRELASSTQAKSTTKETLKEKL